MDNPRTECTAPALGRLLVRYELGELDPDERRAFVAHLLDCDHCHEEVYALGPLTAELARERRAARPPAPRRAASFRLWLAAAAVLLALGALGVWTFRASRPADLLAGYAVPRAPYTPAAGTLRSADGAFEEALRAYQESRYDLAAEKLALLLRLEPGREDAAFYRGVALVLAGRDREALPLLSLIERVAEPRRSEARFYSAVAWARTGERARAAAELRALRDEGGPVAARAAELLARLGGR